ncbi:hypothetical protein AB4Y86_03490 [Arthrobacter sp. 2YAF22_2]|uniref:hypothetical protein n=1 Tax=Arthrobacter sp. 2YAF22_2 TaxID=3233029 RepID=UPI003F93BEF8
MTTPTIPLTDSSTEPEAVLPDTTETPQDAAVTPETETDTPEDTGAPEAPSEGDTFPRDYVEKLRKESAGYRDKAKRVDDLAARLHTALVAATGRLADPEDLPFDESRLDDPAALTAAVDDLLARKPHLASRKPRGDVGQGTVSGASDTVDLAGILRSRAS